MNVAHNLAQARGDIPADLVITNVMVPNLFSFEILRADVAVSGDRIVGIGQDYEGVETVDGGGGVLLPGFIDGHCHIESTMVSPEGFAELVLPRGTTAVFADPHEIANTSGMAGLEYMHRASRKLPLDVFLNAPSCVPASSFETPFEELDALALTEMFRRGWCTALGEVMNYPGVLSGDPAVWAKILVSGDQIRTGHAPGLMGKDLCAYLLSRCDSDHESYTIPEAMDKLRLGMWLMIRSGASEHNLEDLAPIIVQDERRCSRCMMVSDDLNVPYLIDRGHMDEKIRMAQDLGISSLAALRMVTLSVAEYFGLRDRGAIAPGYRADMVLVDSLKTCIPCLVWKDGVLVVEDGILVEGPFPRERQYPSPRRDTPLPSVKDLLIPARGEASIRVIGVKPGQVITDHLTLPPTILDGRVVSDPNRDLLKMVVVDRNTGSGRFGLGFVHGMRLRQGALASSVAHDAHNFGVIGTNDQDMIAALTALREMGGGFVAVDDGDVLGRLPLPVGGLMSDQHPEDLAQRYQELETAIQALGSPPEHPFMVMAFLSLSVIPALKLTDQGYVDLNAGGALDLFV
ncbi:MAG: adenine deaminase [Dethiosulfovibrio peptidovorans]|nr:MAG: adenine deaminase [Dethiosulfovibrio peptidovorans]